MAYAATITIKRRTISGRRHYVVTITETDAAAASESQILDTSSPETEIPEIGTVVLVRSTLTAGTGTTVDPKLGTSTGWSVDTQADIWANGAAAAHIEAAPNKQYSGGALFWQAVPDAGTDNAISTEIWIIEGHAPT